VAAQTAESLRVVGLRELVAGLREADPAFAKEIARAHQGIAQLVRAGAVAEASIQGGVAAHAAPSIRVSGTQRSASILIGSTDHPEALGAEFGSVRYRQFKAWRGSSGDAGYFVYPTIRHLASDIDRLFLEAIDRVTAAAFPD
jgi:hypothetical protein